MAVTAADGGRRPQEKDKLSDKRTVRYRASAGRQALEREGRGGWGGWGRRKKMGIEKENESRGNRQQMNLHLCSEASWDSGEKTSQTSTEVRLWSHTLWVYLSEGALKCILIFPISCNNELG